LARQTAGGPLIEAQRDEPGFQRGQQTSIAVFGSTRWYAASRYSTARAQMTEPAFKLRGRAPACGHFGEATLLRLLLPQRVLNIQLRLASDTGYRVESSGNSCNPLDSSELSGTAGNVPDACGGKFT
jgi:hypothetical protein